MTNPKPLPLSRRDFLKLSKTASLGLALSACGFRPTTIPTLTSTPIPTNTPRPTDTSVPTSSSTPTVTPSPTSTATPKPTETPRPSQVIFEDDFDSGLLKIGTGGSGRDGWWKTVTSFGAKVEILEVEQILRSQDWLDSSGRPRGKVLAVTVTGEPVLIPEFGSDYWYHAFPVWINDDFNLPDHPRQTLYAPLRVGVDVWITPGIGYLSLLSAHRITAYGADSQSRLGLERDNDNQLFVVTYDVYGNRTVVPCIDGVFRANTWNRIELVLEDDGRVTPFVNGKSAISSPLKAPKVTADKDNPAGISDAHAGLLVAFSDPNERLQLGAKVLNDNFKVEQFLDSV